MCAPSARRGRRGAATSDGREGHDPGGGGDRNGSNHGSLPQPRSPRRVHVVWNRKTGKRDTGSEGSGAEPVTASPPPTSLPPRPTGGGLVPSHAVIGSRRIRAVPSQRHHWPAVELGGAWAALPLARTGVGRYPGPGNSARREERGGVA